MRRGFPVVLLLAAACSDAPKRQTAAPPPAAATAEMETVEEPAPDAAPEAAEAPANDAFAAATRPKLSDQEYMDATALIQEASGARDASADLAAGRKRLLALPQDEGRTKLPGITIPRDSIPADVTIAKVQGIMVDSDNRHAIRYEMFVAKYALEYNQTMARALR